MVSAKLGSNGVRDMRPPMIKFTPSMWGDIFSTFSLDHQLQETYAKSIEAGKEKVRSMLVDASSGKLIRLLDTIERLGVAYHFKTEMKQKLDEIHIVDQQFDDLLTTAIRFRLLRQNQYQVSSDVFKKFIGKDNKFEDIHSSDVDGLLSLYEACHVRIHGESVLEEALSFTTDHLTCLERVLPEANSLSKDKVQQALQQSLHKGIPIFNIRRYISIYEREESRIELLFELAKINFNFLQNIYKNELAQLIRWWNKFELKSKLIYARDRIVECYLWGVAANFEPQHSYVRAAFAKSMKLTSILDDTYDNYATLEEAELLTQQFERWNMHIGHLPDYMQVVYRFTMSMYEDYEHDARTHHKSFAAPYFKETVKQLARAYNKEQIWIMEREMPSYEEYMKNSVITSCIYIMLTALIPGIESATKQDMDWLLNSEPKIAISIAMMARHLQNLSSHERENREGELLTAVDCYMKDRNVPQEEALAKFVEFGEEEWMNVNTEWAMQASSNAPKEIVKVLVNFARVADVTYKKSIDCYTSPQNRLAQQIVALFVDPIP